MSSLLELVNAPRTVRVNDKDVEVLGISAEGFAQLLVRFPALGKAMSGLGFKQEDLMKAAPEAVAAFIAAGCGLPGNPKAENIARRMPIEGQLDLISEIVKLTFPSGVGPFVEKLQGLGLLVQVQNPLSTSSQESSTSLSEEDTPSEKPSS